MRIHDKKFRAQKKYSLVMDLPPSVEDLQKIIEKMEIQFEEEKGKRQKLEASFIQFRVRSLQREKEFFKILDQLNINKASSIRDNSDIQNIYKKILHNFDTANEKTHHMLETKYKLNYQFMERRVKEVTNYMQRQLSTNKKLSEENIKQIKQEITEVVETAKIIQDRNYKSKTLIDSLEFKNRLLKEEKLLLIDEIINKKKKIVQLNEELNHINGSQDLTINKTLQTQKYMSSTLSQFQPASMPHHRSRKIQNRKGKFSLNINKSEDQLKMHESTIHSLQKSLRRQKSRNHELGSIVTKLQKKDKNFNDQFSNFFSENKESQENKNQKKKKENMLRIIQNLKQRLQMVENPSVGCGWTNNLQEMIQKDIENEEQF